VKKNTIALIIIFFFIYSILAYCQKIYAEPLAIKRFDIQNTDNRELIEDLKFHKWLEYYLTERIKEEESLNILVGQYIISGKIIDFKIRNQRIDRKTGEPISRQFEIIYDFLEETS